MRRNILSVIKWLLIVSLCGLLGTALFACQNPDNPVTPDDGNYEGMMMLVASQSKNAVIDGKLAVNAPNEYAFVKLGDEITDKNVVCYTYANDIADMVGTPVLCKAENGQLISVEYAQDSKKAISCKISYENGRVRIDGADYAMTEAFISSPQKYFFVLDGWSVYSATPDSGFGFGQKSDDSITIFDIDGDGKYECALYTPLYNGVTVSAVNGNVLTLKGGYGSAALPAPLAEGAEFYFKKTLSTKVPSVQSLVNVTIRIDAESTTLYNGIPLAVSYDSASKTVLAPLKASIYNSETDIMNRVDGSVNYWSSAYSSAEDNSGRDSVKKANIDECRRFIYDTQGYIVAAQKVSVDDVDFEALVGATSLESNNGTMVSGTLDIQAMWNRSVSYSTVQGYITTLKAMGLRKLFIVVSSPGYPMFASSKNGYSTRQNFGESITYFKNLGYEYPDHAFAKACHDVGIECYAIYKIYEGGGATAPIGASVGYDQYTVKDMFGQRLGFDSILKEGFQNGKDYRICRRDDGANDNLDGIITKVKIEFLTDEFSFRGNSALRDTEITTAAVPQHTIDKMADGRTYSNTSHHRSYGINVWVSKNNGQYSLYDGNYSYKYTIGQAVIKDANGDEMFGGAKKNIVTLEISGLDIEEDFLAVTFNSTDGMRLNIYSMTHMYSGSREITSSTTRYVRSMYNDYGNDSNPSKYVWGFEDYPASAFYASSAKVDFDGNPILTARRAEYKEEVERVAKFTKYGFEFNWYPYGDEISNSNCIIPLARGKAETFPGGACEAYEEVREAWLSHVELLCKASFDGVEIRLQAHSSMSSDFKNYGYNEPIVEKYKQLYGQNAYDTLMDKNHVVTDEEYIRVMKIRGDFLQLFLEDASKICKEYGAEFSVNLREAYINPIICDSQNEVTWWTMPKVILDWQKVVDISTYVSIKDYIHDVSQVYPNSRAIKEYAHAQGKEVWIHCYDDQAGMLNDDFFYQANRDETISGFVIYEITDVTGYAQKGLGKILADAGYSVVSKAEEIKKQSK